MKKRLLLLFVFILSSFSFLSAQYKFEPVNVDFNLKEYVSHRMEDQLGKSQSTKVHDFMDHINRRFFSMLKESILKNPSISLDKQLYLSDAKRALNDFAKELLQSKEFISFQLNPPLSKDTILFDGTNYVYKSAGQPCDNSDFETGDFTSWELSEGAVNNQPYGFGSVIPTTAGTQHFIVSGGTDPNVPGNALPKLNPNGGSYSVQLGDYANGSKCGIMRQTFLVDANHTSYAYSYALVMQDPSDHTLGEKPFFKVNMYDENNNSLICGEYSVISGPGGDPGFIPFDSECTTIIFITTCVDAYYLPWRTTFIPLDSYVGQNVTIEFVSGDCSQSGHWGYAYLDADCSSVQIDQTAAALCSGDPIVISAPEGAASYLWSPGGETTESITVSQPGTYTVTVTPVSGSGCSIDLATTITGSMDIPTADFTVQPTSICVGSDVTVTDQSTITGTSTITSWEWDFDGDGVVDATEQTPENHTFDTPGNFNVTLTVSANGCTDSKSVAVQVNNGPDGSWTPPDSLCYNVGSIDLNGLVTGQAGGTWSGVGVTGNSFDVTNGTQDVTYTLTTSTCEVAVTHTIPVLEPITINFPLPEEVCLEATSIPLTANPTGGVFTMQGQPITEFNPASYGVGSYEITYSVSPSNYPTCVSDSSVTIKVVDGLTITSNIPDKFCYQADDFIVNFTPAGGTSSGDLINGTTLAISTASSGNYSIQYQYVTPEGCSSDYSKTFTILPEAQIDFDFEQSCFQTVSFTAKGMNYSNYQWLDGTKSIGTTNTITQQLNPAGVHSITLSAVNGNGCKAISTQLVDVAESDNLGQLQIPNVMTMNGDGTNDAITMPMMDDDCVEYKVTILNRWGNVVYVCDKGNPTFYGKNKDGNVLSEGVYYYRIDSKDIDCSDDANQSICHGFIHIVK